MSSEWTAPPVKTGEGGDYVKPPAGNQPAVLVGLIDLGTQRQRGLNGKPDYDAHRVYFVFELVASPNAAKPGQNHVIATDVTWSMHEKSTMYAWLTAWNGKVPSVTDRPDIGALLGKACLLNVIDKVSRTDATKVYAKIDRLAACYAGMAPLPPAKFPLFSWNLKKHVPGQPIVIPDWVPFLFGRAIPEVIAECRELKVAAAPSVTSVYQMAAGTYVPPASSPPVAPQHYVSSVAPMSPVYAPPPPRPSSAAVQPPVQQAPTNAGEMFYVDHSAFPQGTPYCRQDIQDWIPTQNSRVADLLVCKVGETSWVPAATHAFSDTPF